jgi:hypothetical protein
VPPIAAVPAAIAIARPNAGSKSGSNTPAVVRSVGHGIAIGDWSGIVVYGTVPSSVNIPCAVHHCPAIDISARITRGVADIDYGRRVIIDMDVLDVVNRIFRGDRIDFLGDRYADRPGARWIIRYVPNGLVTAIV